MKLKVPYFKQDTNYSCGAASFEMVLRYFGVVESERDLMKELHTNPDVGTRHQALILVAQKHGFYCYVHDESRLDEIKYYLHLDFPVLVHYIEPTNNEGHYSVVVGFEDGSLILNDPWNGEDFRIGHDAFLERWKSSDNKNVRWLMTISKEKISAGKVYLPLDHSTAGEDK